MKVIAPLLLLLVAVAPANAGVRAKCRRICRREIAALMEGCIADGAATCVSVPSTITTTTTTTASSTTTTTLRFMDNGDGTVTDHQTGLQWEKKTDDGTAHDKDNAYSWSTDYGGTSPNGTAFTSFLASLNGCVSSDGVAVTGGFAGYCDWRLPTIAELQTIVDTSHGSCAGGSGACIDPIFGPTAAESPIYWSGTTSAEFPDGAWGVVFIKLGDDGNLATGSKGAFEQVRAVRSLGR